MFKKILVPTDGSDLSNRAVRAAIEFAKDHGSAVVGLSVAQTLPYESFTLISRREDFSLLSESLRQRAREYVHIIEDLAEKACVPCQVHTIENTQPWKAITEAASEHACDCIFMASHGRSGLNSILLGNQTHKVLVHSNVPVIIFK
jgi:nucleotide-binding universal stress UspA family protein